MLDTILTECHKNADGIVAFYNAEGQECINMFEVAVQAMLGSLEFGFYSPEDKGLKPRYINIDMLPKKPDADAKIAMDYILKNAIQTRQGGYTWAYNYDVIFRGEKVLSAPWFCTFGHAFIIQALLYWYSISGDDKYLMAAEKSALYLFEDIAEGGLRHSFEYCGETMVFFEELPQKSPTSILNAHLVLLEALGRLSAISPKREVKQIFQEGLRTAERLLPLYETNRWSRYDLPENVSTVFRFSMAEVPEIWLSDFQLQNKDIPLCSKDIFDETEKMRLAGVDWGTVENINSVQCRKIINGNCIRETAPAGGTLQNSYCFVTVQNVRKALLEHSNISVLLRLYSKSAGKFSLEIKDEGSTDSLSFLTIKENKIFPGWNTLEFELSPSFFSIPLSREYHKFHTDLLFALEKYSKVFHHYARVFQRHLFYRKKQQVMNAAERQFSSKTTVDTVFISINSTCGCSCKMCDIGTRNPEASLYKHCKGSAGPLNMSMSDYSRILEHLEGRAKAIAFIATEPLLHPEASAFFKLAASKGFDVHVTTNSIALDKNIEVLLNSSIKQLWFSVDGVGLVHDRIRGVSGLFERMKNGVCKILEEKHKRNLALPLLYFNFTIVPPYNCCNMVEYIQFLAQFKEDISGISFSHMNYISKEVAKRHNQEYPSLPISASLYLDNFDFKQVDYPAFLSEITAAKKMAQRLHLPIGFSPDINDLNDLSNFYLKPETIIGNPFCLIPWKACEIGVDGTCYIAGRCYQISMGNLVNETFEDIWNGENYQRFRSFLQSNESLPLPCLRCCGSL